MKHQASDIAPFVCWSSIQENNHLYDPYGAIIHIQNPETGGNTTLCGIQTNGWQFNIHADLSNVSCKRCLKKVDFNDLLSGE